MTPSDAHMLLTGKPPDAAHTLLYESGKAGFSDKGLDKDRFLAVAVLTLQKIMRTGLLKPSRAVLYIAPSHDKWAIEQLDAVSRLTFDAIKNRGGSAKGRNALATAVGNCFKMLFVGGNRLLQVNEVPQAWTSFGFSKEDPIPDWMRDGLL